MSFAATIGACFYLSLVYRSSILLSWIALAFVITDELGAKHKLSGLYTNPVETLELSLFTLSASVVDIYITVTLCWHLRRMRSGLQRTDTLVRRLVVYAVDRGILTTTMQLLSLITYLPLAEKPVYLWTVFHLPASKLYVNSMLAV
ncbi:uncharacterized protein C8Q71DRAFT_738088 [Rhodofomes roseus]|uniref:DUF6534 domain-containing protein n=1 Tax=Rhodofomes roseus TaxID=34475 RepID=A0ABQ8KSD7_9APHY|nr:uncharacterized protein C8Q71DRAFT_738088 [Rhodofomes roseus]KAH9841657.1 hypothetical protein C8Q71DRAFT_738088 [Rhodofomes roseus]